MRFKRPASARGTSPSGAIDPYRTQYGISGGAIAAIVIGSIFAVVAANVVTVVVLVVLWRVLWRS